MTLATKIQLDVAPLSNTISAPRSAPATCTTRSTPADTLAAVRQALLDYKVIFFPGQHLTPEGAQGIPRAPSARSPWPTP